VGFNRNKGAQIICFTATKVAGRKELGGINQNGSLNFPQRKFGHHSINAANVFVSNFI
jgi:hypothetical protein